MAKNDLQDLIRFLGESAQDLYMQAVLSSSKETKKLTDEADELMALRSNLLERLWDEELHAQMPLPLRVKEAA